MSNHTDQIRETQHGKTPAETRSDIGGGLVALGWFLLFLAVVGAAQILNDPAVGGDFEQGTHTNQQGGAAVSTVVCSLGAFVLSLVALACKPRKSAMAATTLAVVVVPVGFAAIGISGLAG